VAPLWFTALIAFVAPAAALGGVVLGQRMQRSTAREQLAEQRRVHELTWSREDRHRFSSEKRAIYAEFLSAVQQNAVLAESWLHSTRIEINSRLSEHPTADKAEVHRAIVKENGYRGKRDELDRKFRTQLAELELVAPESLREAAVQIVHVTILALNSIVLSWNNDKAFERIIEAVNARGPLLVEMRRDLGQEVD
jgi:hypothetical protein